MTIENLVDTSEVVAVFTTEAREDVLKQGGSQYWRLNANRVRQHGYVVCVQNEHHPDSNGSFKHGTAFLIGKIVGVVPTDRKGERHKIEISEYAELTVPNVWKGDRYPVRYATMADLGIDAADLEFKPVPEPEQSDADVENVQVDVLPLTLSEAKAGLAATLGVDPTSIEVTVRA